ncbi:MAG: TIGR01212 family radical SAM protein [Tannerellaceae bacterium]|nr:TIGR01212 family radical SAM protein [Tannerellaceae bacterium]
MNYRSFSDFLRLHFPFKVQKIAVDAGFSCPNRDGTKGFGGCAYCDNSSFSPPTVTLDDGIRFFARKYPRMKYLIYFQSHTNTHAPLPLLQQTFESALAHPHVVGLVIATRPDCLPDPVLHYLAGIARRTFLLIEVGVESTSDLTLQRINRLHSWNDAQDAIRRINAHGIFAGAHIILGLPGESRDHFLLHAQRLAQLPLSTLKLHHLQLIRNTPLAHQYLSNPADFHLFTLEEYIDLVIDFIQLSPPLVAFDRFVSQAPPHKLLLPGWGLKNHQFIDLLHQRLNDRFSCKMQNTQL